MFNIEISLSYEENLKKISEAIQKQFDPRLFLIGKFEDNESVSFKYGDGVDDLKELSDCLKTHNLIFITILKYGISPCFISDLRSEFQNNNIYKKYKIRSFVFSKIPHTKLFICCFWSRIITISKNQLNKFELISNNLFINNLLATRGYISYEKGAPIEVLKHKN